jgi:hypothetical protein
MKRFGLVIRLILEAAFGLICMVDLLLLPQIWRGRINVAVTAGELLGVTVVILIGLLCFKDVLKIFRLLKRAVE